MTTLWPVRTPWDRRTGQPWSSSSLMLALRRWRDVVVLAAASGRVATCSTRTAPLPGIHGVLSRWLKARASLYAQRLMTAESSMHASWRLAVARTAADAYAGNRRLAAFVVAGSVGAGLADEFSDLELDCYWSEPPSDRDRLAPIDSLGGRLEAFWDFDA